MTAPPVYDPGGPVALLSRLPERTTSDELEAAEQAAQSAGCVLAVVDCPITDTATEAILAQRHFTRASSWCKGTLQETTPPGSGVLIRAATAGDVARFLEIGEIKRHQYATFSPVFWRVAPAPRETFAPYVTMQIEKAENIAVVAERKGTVIGYCLLQPAREAGEAYVDDYTVEIADDWERVGTALLSHAASLARERGIETATIVTGWADERKRAAVASLGYELQWNLVGKTAATLKRE